ncbi:hypothetical protein JCM3770_004162 [Rhodotorula araucariae]
MSAFDQPYRPRALTREEEERERERARQTQERVVKRAKKEQEQHEERTTSFHHSGISGIAYKDFKLGRGAPVKSRALLDAQAYAARQREDEGELLDAVPRLSSCCLRVLVDNYGELGVFDALDPVRHRAYAAPLLGALERRSATGALPFQVWLDFAHRFAHELPAPRRTYRGLCVSDRQELSLLKDLNAEARERWAQDAAYPSPGRDPLVPPFYLAYLDLRGDTTFTDADVYKLRNPLSHFLAVLRLDGTGITDEALVWIARAAKDPPQYAQLQVLSLRGLLAVTDEGILRLACLPSLRSLDLRGTHCTPSLRGKLNSTLLSSPSASQQRFWRPPRPRPDLPPSLPPTLEAQLFEPSDYAPSRVLATLHYLARIEAAPPGAARKAIARARAVPKPLGVHLTSISRSVAGGAPAASRAEQSAEEHYRAQLVLAYGAKHAAHHASFGAVTSTVPLSREAVEEEGRREGDRDAAFRHRNDAVAAGEYVGVGGRTGGRTTATAASLYDVGTRRVTTAQKEAGAREPFSDSEGENEREAALDAEERDALARWTVENSQRGTFYRRAEPPKSRGPRTFAEPPPSNLLLLRHFPYAPPWEGAPFLTPSATLERAQAREEAPVAGGALVKKRKRPLFDAATPSPAPTRTPCRAPPPAPSPTPSANPFSKRHPPSSSSSSAASRAPALYTARSASKNIVKTAPALTKRSALSAFMAKK